MSTRVSSLAQVLTGSVCPRVRMASRWVWSWARWRLWAAGSCAPVITLGRSTRRSALADRLSQRHIRSPCGSSLSAGIAHVGASGTPRTRVQTLVRLGHHRGSAEVLCAAFWTKSPPVISGGLPSSSTLLLGRTSRVPVASSLHQRPGSCLGWLSCGVDALAAQCYRSSKCGSQQEERWPMKAWRSAERSTSTFQPNCTRS